MAREGWIIRLKQLRHQLWVWCLSELRYEVVNEHRNLISSLPIYRIHETTLAHEFGSRASAELPGQV